MPRVRRHMPEVQRAAAGRLLRLRPFAVSRRVRGAAGAAGAGIITHLTDESMILITNAG